MDSEKLREEKIKVLYIAGCDRSGSTVLDQILGQIPGWFTIGEVSGMWDRGGLLDCGRAANSLCGCGSVFRECDIWQRVFREAFHVTPDQFDFATASALRNRCARFRHLCLLLNSTTRKVLEPSVDAYVDLIGKLYKAVSTITSAKVLVDSSKQPSHAHILKLTGITELFVVHLVRDPRGCAYSWLRSKSYPDPMVSELPTVHPVRTSLDWLAQNTAIRRLSKPSAGRYLLLRYEDFMARPEDCVHKIIQFVGESVTSLPFLSAHSASLAPTHGISGNPVRFDTGTVNLKVDDRWRSAMRPIHKLLVTMLTGPSLPRYGYGLERQYRVEGAR